MPSVACYSRISTADQNLDRQLESTSEYAQRDIGAFAEWQARVKQMNTKEGISARQVNDKYHHGRAPLGFEKDEGELFEGPDYDRVCGVLDMVAGGEMSKRKAAKELETSRRSIGRALDERPELYGL